MTQSNSFEDIAKDYKTLGRLCKSGKVVFPHLFQLKDVTQEDTKELWK